MKMRVCVIAALQKVAANIDRRNFRRGGLKEGMIAFINGNRLWRVVSSYEENNVQATVIKAML